MKIDNSGKPLASTLSRPSPGRPAVTGSKSEATQQESVSINPLAAKMQAHESAANAPAFDANKVDAIRLAITEGKFAVRADAIAEKLVSSVRELLAR